eukprot:CAMPEP_0177613996 /NCGR_PEP_ID=MMETSP0419_2-20121207/22363_1 /TAXON_ID=582737 /ORGANISM="Tetraselmis sp., Strain GSL018" /LENGTH=49 /DNA_ID= /DNA_START= /DNA_END= /DNA_ORIENTATION=
MSRSPGSGLPTEPGPLHEGLFAYEDNAYGLGLPHIQDLSSPSEGHQLEA